MTAFRPSAPNLFHLDWLVPVDATTADDCTRAVALKAETLLRSARFIEAQADAPAGDVEVRVWVQGASANACVSITWEPGEGRFGFHLLDEGLRERLACIVFEGVPCVDARASLAEADRILDAVLGSLAAAPRGEPIETLAERVRHAEASIRIPVLEGSAWDSGVSR